MDLSKLDITFIDKGTHYLIDVSYEGKNIPILQLHAFINRHFPEGGEHNFTEVCDGFFGQYIEKQGKNLISDLLPESMLQNLLNRGHTLMAIQKMNPKVLFREALVWNGYHESTDNIYSWVENLVRLTDEGIFEGEKK